ncbi:MAG: hypothetical protein JSR48_10345 [Verrucomicrobia bacterium]|nr:hypothetical protein [Verrucomicrobiota bacterium]
MTHLTTSIWLRRLSGLAVLAGVVAIAPLARAMSVVPPKFTELVGGSDYVVRTIVKSVKSEWRESHGQLHIYTLVELDVTEVVAGTPPHPLVLRILGGKVGGDELVVEGAPQFVVGQEDILFVRGNGKQFFPLTAVTHGRYPVVKDPGSGREYVARNNGEPLQAVTDVAKPLAEGAARDSQAQAKAVAQALTPTQFIQQIRAAMGAKTNARVN